MRAAFNTLFGRLFGVLLVAIVLAHVLAFFWFRLLRPARRRRPRKPLSSNRTAR